MDLDKIKSSARKHALKNSLDYGKAVPGNVVGKVIADCPDCKSDMKATMSAIADAVNEANAMNEEEIHKAMAEFEYAEKIEKTNIEKIRDKVPNAVVGKVVTRLPPEPNAAALHIGHAKAMWLDRVIAEIFNGKTILRWDDTNPEKEKEEYIPSLKADLEWLGIKWDSEVFASDYIPLFYKYCEKLLKDGNSYVCTCSEEQVKQGREQKTECACRNQSADRNIALWEKMLSGEFDPGKAVVRFKGDMQSENTTMRDPSLFRIVEAEHFRQGRKYRVWPLYDFESVVMDSPDTIGITHPLRSKEYELRNDLYFLLAEKLGLKKSNLITISRLAIPGYPVSKRLIKPLVDENKVWGWDDPRLVTIKGLARRGIQPEAIKEFVLQFGISTSESNPDLERLFAENRKIIDKTSQRRMFVPDAIGISVEGAPKTSVQLVNHPEMEMGSREIFVSQEIFISEEDLENISEGETIRLKDLYNVIRKGDGFVYAGNEHLKEAKKIQWAPKDGVACKVYVPGKLFDDNENVSEDSLQIDEGICEPSCAELEEGDIIQFERYGFVRVDKVSDEEIICIFCHK